MSKNHHATCDVDVLESCIYQSAFLILALDGGDWSPAPIGQDVVVAKWICSCPSWESNFCCVVGSLATVDNYSSCYLITLLYNTLYCKGCSGSNACAKVSRTSFVTWKGTCPILFVVLELQSAMGYSLVNVVVCIVSLESKLTKLQTVTEILIYGNAMPNWNSLSCIGFLWWRYCVHKYCASWVRKSSSSGGNLDLNNQLQSGTVIGTGKKLTNLLKKINSKSYVKPLKRFK